MNIGQWISRTANLIGAENIERISASRVAVFGIGGVGGHCAEALARSGIGAIDLFDNDKVCSSNINRQIVATVKTIGRYKTDIMRERILEINPNIRAGSFKLFYSPETADSVDLSVYDYIVDAVDTISAKLELIRRADSLKTPVISAMGAANKLDPSAFEVADIYETSVCPLARIMRRELRRYGIGALKVVYSKEPPRKPYDVVACLENPQGSAENPQGSAGNSMKRHQIPASCSFVPPVAGMILAGEVIRDLCEL